MLLERTASLAETPEPLRQVERPPPEPGPGEVRLRVLACGVCHTELDEIEGRLPAALPVIPGHQVIGTVDALGRGASRHQIGARLGVGWIYHGSGTEHENIEPGFIATGRDVDGGYADAMVVPEDYACPIPGRFEAVQAAPLLCAGAIGHRALRLCGIDASSHLGLMGFGGSAHLVLQYALRLYPGIRVHAFARTAEVQAFAVSLGATSAGAPDAAPPQPLDAIIDTTPAWAPIVYALAALKPGGRLVINAIRKEDTDKRALLSLSYEDHLWMERELRSVANITRLDVADFVTAAGRLQLTPSVRTWPLEHANRALRALATGGTRGAHVLDLGLSADESDLAHAPASD